MSLENFGLQRASRILSPILFFFLLARLDDFHEKLQRLAFSRYKQMCTVHIQFCFLREELAVCMLNIVF
jgi:hypothetical protein